MMGIKSYQEKLFCDFPLSDPDDHLLRTLNELFDMRVVRKIYPPLLGSNPPPRKIM